MQSSARQLGDRETYPYTLSCEAIDRYIVAWYWWNVVNWNAHIAASLVYWRMVWHEIMRWLPSTTIQAQCPLVASGHWAWAATTKPTTLPPTTHHDRRRCDCGPECLWPRRMLLCPVLLHRSICRIRRFYSILLLVILLSFSCTSHTYPQPSYIQGNGHGHMLTGVLPKRHLIPTSRHLYLFLPLPLPPHSTDHHLTNAHY